MSSDDKNWPMLGTGKSSAPTPRKLPPVNSDKSRNYYLFIELEISGWRLGQLIISISFSDVVRRGSPPPSPTLPTLPALLPPSKPNDVLATSVKRSSKPSALPAGIVAADSFPPLSPSPSPLPVGVNKDKNVPARKNSYAAATGTGTGANHKARPTVVTTGACVPTVSESPVSLPSTGSNKVISLNIGSVPVPDVRSATPPPVTAPSRSAQSPKNQTPKQRRKTSAPSNTLSPPQFVGRNRSASTSSVATSIVTTSSRGPPSSKTSVCPTPTLDNDDWKYMLTELAKQMTNKDRAAWEKILRCDPKDTSKMKWSAFEKALKALKFKAHTRGGSETEYTPDPEYFGTKAQPISYHRPHPGSDFTLGDLKAKSNSFRQQYAAAVAVLHDAWDLVDTRQ
ncbi:unnamed protein product [Rhizoctonia solani]|uniref:Uncharacterized protein n=1 Tax=Rhizoctonia solani TaxID=456999 RepID=A0A8H3DLK4_9AGAM|nr:unnamed protein product [Rhizoctonia solani]